MNVRTLIAFLGVVAGSGCIVHNHDHGGGGGGVAPPARPGDVTFSWSFAGLSCNDVPQVKSVWIDIPGERLQNGGVYPCLANGYPGIVLHDFLPGTYTFTIEGLGYGNERLYVGAGSFRVDGNVRVAIDLTPVGGPSSYAYLTWRFPPNSQSGDPSCDQAGVAWVDVSIDGSDFQRYDCRAGQSNPGVQTPFLKAGTHRIYIEAVTSSGYPLYRYDGSLQTFAGQPVSAEYRLNWGVGGTAVKWQLTNGSVGQTCSQASVQTMSINFMDERGQLVYGSQGDIQACDSAPIVYNYLQPGTYKVFIKGTGPNGVVYLSNASNPPVVVVRAGEFVSAQQAITVQLFRAQ